MVLGAIVSFVLLAAALFIPGYFLALAFFARRGEIDAVERATLSFVFSITFLPLLVLVANQLLGIPINFYSVAGTFLLLVVAGLFGYLARAGMVPLPLPLRNLLGAIPREDAVQIIPWKKGN